MTNLLNPWLKLANDQIRQGYILKEEQSIIAKFNAKVGEEYKIHTSIFPAPFMGNVHTAPVLILVLNPGYDEKEEKTGYYRNYESWWLKQIQYISPIENSPLFCLDDEYIKQSPYWKQKLQPLINKAGVEKVAKNIAKVQFFPYHSKKFKPIYKKLLKEEYFSSYLPSQEYNFQLVRSAMERDALIIIPRSKKFWYEAIPELRNYPNIHFTKSYGNIIFSENNLGASSFRIIVDKVNK
ncbi:hypothetical protein LB465_12600 [Salegentibacter sp. LM13S]|uniref:hypothetical protein n=1 Tax=Salegentibacter lacus TaxID=2873599 RepID=UPI001CCF2ACC|nr:hypothetical protein [Salegentibacter lacus]MBZ9631622.1 hypothetical protein [Salegentibacter lacus]